MSEQKKIVTMGGGTGTFPVVTALKALDVAISAIVSVSDSGGSTGRIRDEFGFQPVGDLRQSLAALADVDGQAWIQKLLLYRFEKGEGLKGHNLGNLILTALQDMTGNTTQSLEIAEKIFNLHGSVIPVTNANVNLKINYIDGTSEIGEHILDEDTQTPKQIKSVELVPSCTLNTPARTTLQTSNLIIIGPGDFYASVMSTLVVTDLKETLMSSNAKIVYMSNLMTRRTQTHNMTAQDHVDQIEAALGKPIDFVVCNSAPIPEDILEYYAAAQEFPVKDDLPTSSKIIRADLLSHTITKKQTSDTAHRSLLRHDPKKLVPIFEELLKTV